MWSLKFPSSYRVGLQLQELPQGSLEDEYLFFFYIINSSLWREGGIERRKLVIWALWGG